MQRMGKSEWQVLRKLQFLRQQMQYFVTLIEEYILNEVIQSQWLAFKTALEKIDLFEELVELHNNYLNTVLAKCFLRRTVQDGADITELSGEKKLQTTLNLIFTQVFKLNHLIKEYGTSICSDEEAIADVAKVTKTFNETAIAIYTALRNMAYKGQHQELFLKLDFNRFFAKQSQRQL